MPKGSVRSRRSQAPAALAVYLGVCGIGSAVLAVAGCGSDAAAAESDAAVVSPPSPAAASTAAVPTGYDPHKSLAPMIKAVGPAVVAIYTQGRGGQTKGAGSGFILSEDGLVLTNHHVVQGARDLQVRLSTGQRFDARVLGTDEATDLALLRLADAEKLPVAALGDSAALEVGDWVVAIGNPMGLEHSASVGILSGKGRGDLGLYRSSYLDFLQTDADIAPGSSGGPLFDLQGKVVGITTAVGAGSRPGFAIPIDTARRVVAQLEKHGKVARGWLGAASVAEQSRPGAWLGEIYDGTPAHAAGLQEGDVVLAVDGDAIGSFAELRSRIATTEPGNVVALDLEREGRQLVVEVTLKERPGERDLRRLRPAAPSATPDRSRSPRLPFGIKLPQGTPSRGGPERLGVQARGSELGLEVVSVEPDSLAESLGLQPGDRITELNGATVRDAATVASALADNERKVTVRFEREGTPHRVTLERS